jgi:hypothetical protein
MVKGERTTVTHWIEGVSGGMAFVARVVVDAVIPDADPSEPCLEPATLRKLDELRRLARAGDVAELAKSADVYFRRTA